MPFYEQEEPGFLRKYRVIIGCGLVVVLGIAAWLGRGLFDHSSRSHAEQRVTFVNLLPPPPLPATPPPPAKLPPLPAETEEKMISQIPVNAMEFKSDEVSKGPSSPGDSGAPGTNLQGDGPADGFGLRKGNGLGNGTGAPAQIASRGNQSRWGWYASQVQLKISEVLQDNSHTRNADFRIDTRIWPDRTGRITRAQITGSTGNEAVDRALTNDILVGLVLQEPPPDGMPMPIVLRLTAHRPKVAFSR